MLLITHSLVGATLATKINQPFFSLPLAFGAHFLMDAIPHWDLGIDFNQRSKIKNFFLALADGLTSLALVFFLFQINRPLTLKPWLGMAVCLLPDFIEAPYLFLGFHILPALDWFHSNLLHRDNKNVFKGLLPQIIIILFCILIST